MALLKIYTLRIHLVFGTEPKPTYLTCKQENTRSGRSDATFSSSYVNIVMILWCYTITCLWFWYKWPARKNQGLLFVPAPVFVTKTPFWIHKYIKRRGKKGDGQGRKPQAHTGRWPHERQVRRFGWHSGGLTSPYLVSGSHRALAALAAGRTSTQGKSKIFHSLEAVGGISRNCVLFISSRILKKT